MTYHVYLLECADQTIYTGITTNVARRLLQHQQGKGGNYTRAHGAKRMIYSELHATKGDALKRECQLKQFTRAKKLQLIGTIPNHADNTA